MDEEKDERCHRAAIEAANELMRKLPINGDDKQYAAGLALDTWRSVAMTVAKENTTRDVIGAVFAWALKYNETYWAEQDNR